MIVEFDLLPQAHKSIISSNFEKAFYFDAAKLINNSQISISYKKGSIDTYFIVSGITNSPDGILESKVKYRNADNSITSQCTCREWTEEDHCRHITALCLKYFLIEQEIKNLPNQSSGRHYSTTAAYPGEYGTIIAGPQYLKGDNSSMKNGSYFSGQYQLVNGKVINFPIPIEWKGRLLCNLIPAQKFQMKGLQLESEYLNETIVWPIFKWQVDEKNVETISIFENLYMFDWTSGMAHHLPEKLKDFIREVRNKRNQLTLDDYLRARSVYALEDLVDFSFEDQGLENLEVLNIHPTVKIFPAEKKHFSRIEVQFVDKDQIILPLPKELRLLTFENGLLDSFAKKTQALEFVEHFIRSYESPEISLIPLIRKSKQRDDIELLSKSLLDEHDITIFDHQRNSLVKYDKTTTKQFLISLLQCFGQQTFRYSTYSEIERKLTFEMRSSNLLEGINVFHLLTSPYGADIYYNDKKISRWSGNIKFERKNSDINWFDLEIDISQKDLEVIQKANLESGYALTKDGLSLLGDDQNDIVKFMQKYTQYESQKKQDKGELVKFHLPLNRSRIFELFELKKQGIDGALTKDEIELCNKLLNLTEMPKYPIPKHLDDILRDYQKTGVNWLNFLYENKFGACLADDMGLGKTIQTISFIQTIYEKVDKILIICPVSILLNWQQEFEKFSDIDVCVYYGTDRTLDNSKKIFLTSYGILKKEVSTTFKDYHFDLLIMDEVQNLKNIRSQGASSARLIKAGFKICLTGTPVENDISEFYNILDLSVPGIWGDLKFVRTQSSVKGRLLARKMARPFILRRTKDQVLKELPPRTENNIVLNFNDQEREKYIYTLAQIRHNIENVTSKRKYGEILKGLLKLRQLSLWQAEDGHIQSTKVNYLVKNLEQVIEEGHKALVFSQFTSFLDIIQTNLDQKHIEYCRIDGSQTAKRRQKEIEKFQNGKTQVFLISLKAGGLGLNLTAASYVYLMDPWWNPAVEAQAIDRAHRIGQKNPINVYRLIMKDSVEEKVIKLQEKKRELFNDLLDNQGDEYFSGKLSMEDFKELLT